MIAAGTFPDLIKNYARATNEADKSLMEQVKEQTQAVMAQFLKDNPEAGKGKVLNLDPYDGPGKNGYHPTRTPNAVVAKIDGLFPDLASYIQAVWHEGKPTAEVKAKTQTIRAYQDIGTSWRRERDEK